MVWGLFPDRKIGISDGDRVDILEPEKIVVATGASENSLSFPGWTLPNIMGAGAAQTMVNVNRVLPGQKVLIVGSGNAIVARPGARLALHDMQLKGLKGTNLRAEDSAATIALSDVDICLDHNVQFTSGALEFAQDVTIRGTNTLRYQSDVVSTVTCCGRCARRLG